MKMKKVFIVLFILLVSGFSELIGQIREEFDRSIAKAYKEYQSGDYQKALETFKKTSKIIPQHPVILYYLAFLQAKLKNPGQALFWLNKYVQLGYGYGLDLNKVSDFDSLRKNPVFQEIQKKLEYNQRPKLNCREAFRISERDLIPEGLAYDPQGEVFYMGSTYKSKIIRIKKDGTVSDFTGEKQDGLRSILGMKVDEKRKILWVNSIVAGPRMKGYYPSEKGWSGVFKYNLKSGKLINKYCISGKDAAHNFNDLAITSEGDVYLTDSLIGAIYSISSKRDRLEQFLISPDFRFLNGITLSPDEKYLYIADQGNKIYLVDLQTRKYQGIKHPEDVTTIGIDGLYYYRGSLIAVQNKIQRISRFFLDKTGKTITKCVVFEANNPLFRQIPTTGVIDGDNFYFIANSQLHSFNQDNTIFPAEQLSDIIILKYSFKK
jgi:WD40 repeat protein